MSFSSWVWSTVSNALERSMATYTVRSTGCFLFRPFVICSEMSWSAVRVDLPFLNQCWWSARFSDELISGSNMASRILAAGESSEMGL